MQDAVWVGANSALLLAAGQVPLVKFEIYVDSNWINICDLPGEKLIDRGLNVWTSATNLTHWIEGLAGTSTVNREAAEKIEGNYSCRFDIDAGNSIIQIRQVNITLTPLKRYKIIVWYKNSLAGKTAEIAFRNDGGNVYLKEDSTWNVGVYFIELSNSIIWKKFELEFNAHIDYSTYRLILLNKTAHSSSIYFDNISLRDITSYEIGKNYLESVSVSLGGASMTPNPIGGKWSARLANEGSIFHPDHPTSGYDGYCVSGREVRITIGATYGGVDYYYQRIIGYMDEPKFSTPDYKVSISGQDYMKRLEDAEFQEMDGTHPNHWGLSTIFDSWPSDGLLGAEMYIEGDAMDTTDNGGAGFHTVASWVATNCDFSAIDDGVDNHVGKMINADQGPPSRLRLADIGTNAELGKTYRVKFKHRIVGGDGSKGIKIQIFQAALITQVLYFPTDEWKEETLYFVATANAVIEIRFVLAATAYELWLDDISVWEYKPEEDRYYDLTVADANQKGPFYVTYDDGGGAVPVQQGEDDEGWRYDEDAGHLFFDRNKTVIDGVTPNLDNVVVHYYTETHPEDAVARILWFAGLGFEGTPYADEDAAKTVMGPDDPGFTIDKVWFEAGTSFLSAIKMLCEVCNYRFHFEYDGRPSFKAPPAGGVVFTFSDPSQIASQRTYQSRSEIKNRVIIKGIKQAEPVNLDDSVPSELMDDASDAGSITAYGERTLTITNHLFQHQGRLTAMCGTLRDLYKTPKWYANLKIPFNPVPLELGDEIQWEERLGHDLANITQTGIIRDIKISNFIVTYKVEITTP